MISGDSPGFRRGVCTFSQNLPRRCWTRLRYDGPRIVDRVPTVRNHKPQVERLRCLHRAKKTSLPLPFLLPERGAYLRRFHSRRMTMPRVFRVGQGFDSSPSLTTSVGETVPKVPWCRCEELARWRSSSYDLTKRAGAEAYHESDGTRIDGAIDLRPNQRNRGRRRCTMRPRGGDSKPWRLPPLAGPPSWSSTARARPAGPSDPRNMAS